MNIFWFNVWSKCYRNLTMHMYAPRASYWHPPLFLLVNYYCLFVPLWCLYVGILFLPILPLGFMSLIIMNVCLMYTYIILFMICYWHKLNIINKTSPLRGFHDSYFIFPWAQIEWIQLEGNPTLDSYYLKSSDNKQNNSTNWFCIWRK